MISGQSALTTINVVKELSIGYMPMLLCEITFLDGTVLRMASENLAASLGTAYNGFDWLPRLLNQSLDAISAVSNNGIVQSPSVTLQVADGDKFIWNTYELTNGRGFKGAKLKIYMVYADLAAGKFTTDNRIIFVGTCNAPSMDATTLTVRADNLLQMVKKQLPSTRVQTTCNWVFPTNAAQRTAAADDSQSIYYNCGYSPDIASPNAVGNLNGGAPFTSCDYTYQACLARMGNAALPTSAPVNGTVQIEVDQAGRPTARFSGIFWNAPYDWRGHDYIAGNKTEGINSNNDAKLNDYYPLVYGTCFVDPIVMNVEGDPNSTRFEVALCVGEITTDRTKPDPIRAVLVNDQLIPWTNNSGDKINWWNWDTTGNRTGATMKGPIFNGQGNCYGGIATLLIVVPKAVQASSGIPSVRVLMSAPPIRVYSDATTFTLQRTTNPAWILLDMLRRADWDVSQINLDTFLSEAAYCDTQISYQALDGTTKQHARYKASLSYRDPRTVLDCLTPYLASFRGMLRMNYVDGKLDVLVRKTLADQQPQPIASSNNQNAIGSVTATGAGASGYLAYDFDLSNIKWVNSGPSLHFKQRPYQDTSNRVTVTFQDEEANYATDTLSLIDEDDVTRIGQTIKGNLTCEGLLNFDQSFRLQESMLAEQFRGNPRAPINGATFDTGGTLECTFTTTSKVVDLRVGDICRLNFSHYSISNWLIRITSITPSADYEEAEVIATYHLDDWYTDTYGQQGHQVFTGSANSFLLRNPFAWNPNSVVPSASDALYPATDKQFSISHDYASTQSSIYGAQLSIGGNVPVNIVDSTAGTPLCTTVTANLGGGSIPAGTYWVSAVALDAAGSRTSGSTALPNATLAGPGSLTVSGLIWTQQTASYEIYAGDNPNHLSLQLAGGGTPASVTLTTYNVATQGPPDTIFDHFEVDVERVWHSGTWVAGATAATDNSITVAGAGWTPGAFTGSILSAIAKAAVDLGQPLPIANFVVTGNTSDTITIAGGLAALGLGLGDVFTTRARGTISSATTIGDPNFINGILTRGDPEVVTSITGTTTITVQTRLPHGMTTGQSCVMLNCESVTGNWVVTVVDDTTLTLDGASISNGVIYVNNGILIPLTIGLVPNHEIGRSVLIIGGTGAGQTANIVGNTTTTVTIDKPWLVQPDPTSAWIITDQGPFFTWKSDTFHNQDPTAQTTLSFSVPNSQDIGLLATVYTASSGGKRSLISDSPYRDIWVPLPQTTNVAFDNQAPPPPGSVAVQFKTDPTKPGLISGSVPLSSAGGVNLQTGDYTIVAGDLGKLIVFNSATPVTLTLPSPGSLSDHFYVFIENIGAGDVTLSGTVNNIINMVLAQEEGLVLFDSGTAWYAETGEGGGKWITETPIGTLDGVNPTFALTHTPIPGTETIFLNGVEQDEPRWVSVNAIAVTFVVPPISIDFIKAKYQYNS